MYHGDIRLGSTIDIKFCSVQATGAPTTLAGSPVISAYLDNNTTQLTAGITLTVDFDSVTGLNNVRVVASGGNGYTTATNYALVITTGTVNSVSVVGYVIGTFSIENRSALMPTTATRTLVVDAAGLADANVVKLGPTGSGTAQTARDVGASVLLSTGTGTGQLDFTSGVVKANTTQLAAQTVTAAAGVTFPSSVASPTNITGGTITTVTNLTNAPTAGDLTATMKTSVTTAATAATPTIASVSGAVGSVTGNVGGNVVGSVASVTAGVTVTTNNDKTGYALSTAGVDLVLDRAAGVETSYTLRQALRLILAACAGKLSGAATTTVTIRDVGDTKNRVIATVDANGNRTATTYDVS